MRNILVRTFLKLCNIHTIGKKTKNAGMQGQIAIKRIYWNDILYDFSFRFTILFFFFLSFICHCYWEIRNDELKDGKTSEKHVFVLCWYLRTIRTENKLSKRIKKMGNFDDVEFFDLQLLLFQLDDEEIKGSIEMAPKICYPNYCP